MLKLLPHYNPDGVHFYQYKTKPTLKSKGHSYISWKVIRISWAQTSFLPKLFFFNPSNYTQYTKKFERKLDCIENNVIQLAIMTQGAVLSISGFIEYLVLECGVYIYIGQVWYCRVDPFINFTCF